MDRYLLAYLLIAALIGGLAIVILRARYHSHAAMQKRRRATDAARWAARAPSRAAPELAADSDSRLP